MLYLCSYLVAKLLGRRGCSAVVKRLISIGTRNTYFKPKLAVRYSHVVYILGGAVLGVDSGAFGRFVIVLTNEAQTTFASSSSLPGRLYGLLASVTSIGYSYSLSLL